MSDDRHDGDAGFVEKVVREMDLELLTSQGWSVIERFDQDEPMDFSEEALPTIPPGQNGYCPQLNYQNGSVTLRRAAIARRSFFRIRQDRTAIVAELQAELTQARSTCAESKKTIETHLKAIDKAAGDLRIQQDDNKRLTDDRERVRTQLRDAQTLNTKLERDIGKLREHIGRKMFDEILPPPPPKSA
jgi:hypothetical protein